MSEQAGCVRSKFRSSFIIEIALLVAVVIYMAAGQGKLVGDDVVFTAVGAGLMVVMTYWTLHTLRGGIELLALRLRHGR